MGKHIAMNKDDISYLDFIERMLIEEIGFKHYREGIKWQIYPNPMRDDVVFIAEEKEIEPYPGTQKYPAVPNTPHVIHHGVPPRIAVKLLHFMNHEIPQRHAFWKNMGIQSRYKSPLR